jgi:hypothetical protein
MMDSFGSFVFLHHVTLDMVRTKLAGSVTLSEEAVHSAVEGAISQTLDLLRAEDDPKTVVDPIAREMIRFAARIEHILVSLDRMIDPKPGVAAQSMDVTHALADVDGTAEDIPPSYLVKRALNWVGLQPEGGRSPEFVRVLAQKRAARR